MILEANRPRLSSNDMKNSMFLKPIHERSNEAAPRRPSAERTEDGEKPALGSRARAPLSKSEPCFRSARREEGFGTGTLTNSMAELADPFLRAVREAARNSLARASSLDIWDAIGELPKRASYNFRKCWTSRVKAQRITMITEPLLSMGKAYARRIRGALK